MFKTNEMIRETGYRILFDIKELMLPDMVACLKS
jgi:hypothetical protein